MTQSALNAVDDIALAQAMVRVWGQEAALKASDNACTQTFVGNMETAEKWHRVMVLIAAVLKSSEIQDPARATEISLTGL